MTLHFDLPFPLCGYLDQLLKETRKLNFFPRLKGFFPPTCYKHCICSHFLHHSNLCEGPVLLLRSTLFGSHFRSAHVFYFFFPPLNIQLKPRLWNLAKSNLHYLAFLLSRWCCWWRTSLITTVYFFFFYKPLWIQWLRSATHMCFEVTSVLYWLIISLDWGEKSFYMRSKKAFSFTLNSPWQSSGFAQSKRSSLQFSGLLRLITPDTQSLQAR